MTSAPTDSTADQCSFDDLMRSAHDEYGISGSPFVLPAWWRRMTGRIVSFHPLLFAATVWWLHRCWGFFGRWHRNELAKAWSEFAWRYSLADGLRLARAVKALDAHATFRDGCRALKYRNCLEAMFVRGAFLDPFCKAVAIERTEFTHPLQQPQYFVPGIPAARTIDASQFPWAASLVEQYSAIREEAAALLSSGESRFGEFRTDFENFVPGWNTFNFYVNGRRQDENCRLAPRLAAFADAMIEHEEGELTMLSALNPRSRIPPHVGPLNGILRCHLPLFVPEGCAIRVGGQELHWTPGEILVFDDSFVHEVWNHSDQLRVVLFFNAWHPCLSIAERNALAELRRAYNATPVGRNWLKRQEETRPSTVVHDASVRITS